VRALVLSGGGSRGAWQAGVIKALADAGRRWDVIAGVSVGALNAGLLAQFPKDLQAKAADQLLDFWLGIQGNQSVYKRWFPFGRLHSLWKGSLYDTSPLEKLVKANVDPLLYKTSGVKLIVGAVCLETGDYRAITGEEENIAEWILASSAFPAMFPPRKIDGGSWVDGGVRDITPVTDVVDMKPDEIDLVLTGDLDSGPGIFPSEKTKNVLNIALRTAFIMSDEVFNSDLDRVPEAQLPRIKVYQPPIHLNMGDSMQFDPTTIARLLQAGLFTNVAPTT